MIKIIYNNLIIDLNDNERYLKYLPKQQRFVEVKKYLANAILSSDNNTVYHILGTPYTFPNEIKSVVISEITEEEFNRLKSTMILQNSQEVIDLKREVDDLRTLIAQQTNLIQQLLERFS